MSRGNRVHWKHYKNGKLGLNNIFAPRLKLIWSLRNKLTGSTSNGLCFGLLLKLLSETQVVSPQRTKPPPHFRAINSWSTRTKRVGLSECLHGEFNENQTNWCGGNLGYGDDCGQWWSCSFVSVDFWSHVPRGYEDGQLHVGLSRPNVSDGLKEKYTDLEGRIPDDVS